MKRLQPVGAGLFDYHDPILHSGRQELPDIDAFWNAFEAEMARRSDTWFDVLDLARLRGPWSLPDHGGWSLADEAPYLDLRPYGDLDALLASRSKSLRYDLRRKMRRAEQHGRVMYKTHLDVPLEEVRHWIARLEADRRKRYPGSVLPARYLDTLLTEAGSPKGPAHFSALYLDDSPVSWHAGLADQGVMYWYIPAFDPEYASLSPGKLHLMLAIGDAIARGFDTFDFLRGLETYKAGWSDEVSQLYGKIQFSQHPKSTMRRTVAFGLKKLGRLKARLKGR
jgi:CelD/BcsL family acetyltransferase involved in cellulose biosynthesis